MHEDSDDHDWPNGRCMRLVGLEKNGISSHLVENDLSKADTRLLKRLNASIHFQIAHNPKQLR